MRFHGECVFLRETIVLYPLQVSLLPQLNNFNYQKQKHLFPANTLYYFNIPDIQGTVHRDIFL
jgi:hypothetical protein